jgi:hypothetical protein
LRYRERAGSKKNDVRLRPPESPGQHQLRRRQRGHHPHLHTRDGLRDTITSNGTLWTNSYNNRRLLENETLAYGRVNYPIGRTYDANGYLAKLTYPDNAAVVYNPNGLGEPRQVGSYATGISYHPNGAIASFRYGNAILHTLQ